MTAALATLNHAALVALADCEQRIERGLTTYIDVGRALGEIRDSRLYKGTYDTFEEYCRERWGFTDRRARQLVDAAEIGNMFPVENARQAAALASVPASDRAEVLREAAERSKDGKPTAKAITEIAKERTAPAAQTPGPAAAPSTAPADPGPTPASGADAPVPPREPVPEPPAPPSAQGRELADEIARDSERRAVVAGLRSVLTYTTSRVLAPEELARQYVIGLSEFTAEELRFAAKTMAAIAALKEQ